MLEILASNRSHLLAKRRMIRFAVEGWPACGTPQEALKHHRLDGASLAERILEASD
jgi:transketolase